jgi:hypothetical protein
MKRSFELIRRPLNLNYLVPIPRKDPVLGRWHLINCSFFFVVAGGSGADEVMEG